MEEIIDNNKREVTDREVLIIRVIKVKWFSRSVKHIGRTHAFVKCSNVALICCTQLRDVLTWVHLQVVLTRVQLQGALI